MSSTTSNGGLVVTKTGEREFRTEREFDFSLARVWEAYTDPEQLKQWWGRGNPLTIERYEFEVGGHWRYVETADGQQHGFEGRFAEIVARERVVHSFEWDGMPARAIFQIVEFEALDNDRTRIVTTSRFYTTEERDGMLATGMEQGLGQSYDALDRLLAG